MQNPLLSQNPRFGGSTLNTRRPTPDVSRRTLAGLLTAGWLLAATAARAVEDPPGCSLSNGGAGNTSQGGINFNLAVAHVGDIVPVFPALGMATNACRAINATGVVYVATGPLTNFLVNVTLNPGPLISCPSGPNCAPGPYNLLITAAMVGAAVDTPSGRAAGQPKTVRAVETGFGTVLAGEFNEQLSDFHTASIQIVTPCLQVFQTCDLPAGQACFAPEIPVHFRGYVTNCGDITLTNVTVRNDRTGQQELFNPTNGQALTGNVVLPPGAFAVFSNTWLPTLAETCAGIAPGTLTATAQDTTQIGGPNAAVTNTFTGSCSICILPAVVITKQCPADPVEPGGVLTYTGSVSNAGNSTLTNILVVNDQPAIDTPVLGPITLGPGAVFAFTNSYAVALDSCGPYADTLTVRAHTTCGSILTNTATAVCASTNRPGIAITKDCPPGPVQPGEILTVTGTVTNTGNITLTNVVVTNSIAALGNESRLVLGPISLAPGAGVAFNDSYTVPLDACGPYADTFAASGTDQCFGRVVTQSATQACAGTNSPSLEVTKTCPAEPVEPGQPLTVTGTVTNAGNITLTNVVVTNTIAALGNESRLVLGPISLAPGAGAAFSDSYTVPLDSCGLYADTFTASGADQCFGRVVTDSDTQACGGTNSPSLEVTKACPAEPVEPGQLLTVTGTVTNTGNITLTNVLVTNTIAALGNESRLVLGPISLAPGAGAAFSDSYTVPLDSCGPYTGTFAASGADQCFGRVVTDTETQACAGTNSPSLEVIKTCPAGPVEPGQRLTVTGTVTNTGNITLTNVVVTNTIAALGNESRLVLGPISLAPGAAAAFSDSYTVPRDSCGPYADTFAASGEDQCFARVVTHSATQACAGTNSPSLEVIKFCPPGLVQPGQLLTVNGTVTNTGNITLTNVVVTNLVPALGNEARLVLGPITLAPGARTNFQSSYLVPLDSCGPYLDTFVASGADQCFGRVVTDSATQACPGTNAPRITVTKSCPAVPPAPGQLATISGVVSNAGNIGLTNVLVYDDQPAANTLVLGPIDLAAGQAVSFSNRYVLPPNFCAFVDMLRATGRDKCFGRTVAHSAAAVCPTATLPLLAVSRNCPPLPNVPGQPQVFTGSVSNAGNITLTNVLVVNNQPSNNTPVLGPLVLAPGEQANFIAAFLVPTNTCETNILATVTASGQSMCSGTNVSASHSTLCPIQPAALLVLTKACPAQPVALGGLLTFSGTVTNAGNLTVTNVFVFNEQPTNHTPVLGPLTLAPGEGASFSGSYPVCTECCPPFVDTLTAIGAQICDGSNVIATASSACPGFTTPQLALRVDCPPAPALLGEVLFYSGSLSNAGDVTLDSVLVFDDKSGFVTQISTLAPSETADFFGFYLATNCGPAVVTRVSVTAFDMCSDAGFGAQASAVCDILCSLTNTTATELTSLTNCPGSRASFSTVADGPGPFRYQWSKDGTPIADATNSAYTMAAVQAGDAGTYCVVVTGEFSGVTNCATLTVLTNTSATELASLTNCPGSSASFSTVADGPGPFRYQWSKDGTPIADATNSAYALPAVQAADAATYCVIVTGHCTSVTNCATLTVLTNTTATSLTSLTNNPGSSANFSTVADGSGPFSYQWTKDGSPLAGATNSALTITNLNAINAGQYCVIVTGHCTSVTNCATLTVLIEPPVLLDPRIADGQFQFTFVTVAGRTNTVQYSDALEPTNWQPVTNFVGTGGLVTITDPMVNQQRYYRVLIP